MQNLISDDPKRKIQAAKDIRKIADHLQPARTRNELLKYFYEFYDDNDEVISVFVSQLDGFVDYIGFYSHIFLAFMVKKIRNFCRTYHIMNTYCKENAKKFWIFDNIIVI